MRGGTGNAAGITQTKEMIPATFTSPTSPFGCCRRRKIWRGKVRVSAAICCCGPNGTSCLLRRPWSPSAVGISTPPSQDCGESVIERDSTRKQMIWSLKVSFWVSYFVYSVFASDASDVCEAVSENTLCTTALSKVLMLRTDPPGLSSAEYSCNEIYFLLSAQKGKL